MPVIHYLFFNSKSSPVVLVFMLLVSPTTFTEMIHGGSCLRWLFSWLLLALEKQQFYGISSDSYPRKCCVTSVLSLCYILCFFPIYKIMYEMQCSYLSVIRKPAKLLSSSCSILSCDIKKEILGQ